MLRSYLYVPADRPDRVEKAMSFTGDGRPDAVIIDLEDAVAMNAKARARASLTALLGSARTPEAGPSRFVRINSGTVGQEDLRAIDTFLSNGQVRGIAIPKATADAVATVAAFVRGRAQLMAIVESAQGLHEVTAVAGSADVDLVSIGEADLCADLGIRPGTEHALWPLRMMVVAACSLGGIDPPIGPVHLDVRNSESLSTSCEALRDAGFGARPAIHPNQVATINEKFRPSPDEMSAATDVIRAYETARAAGTGVVVDANGRMLDEAVVRSARRVLEGSRP